MAASSLQLELGSTGPALLADLAAVSAIWLKRDLMVLQPLPENSGFQSLIHRAPKVTCGTSQAAQASGNGGMTAEESQEFLWKWFFSDPTQWWDNRWSKNTPQHPDFRHKKSKVALWLNNRHKPVWVESQLATWDSGITRPPESVSTSLPAHDDDLEVEMWRKLCEDGEIAEAVSALNHLVQRGCHLPEDLYYRVLKKCVANKDLVLGRQIYALAVKGGYEGHAFLATHFIGLYASHGRLKEAMRVFAKVSTPDVYNWATIIFAYARHGEPAQAIRLYQQMRRSPVKPDNHIFIAVLKACATARDLAAGKDVHAHLLASAGVPDIFVQTCLVDMYAKCGNIEDARRVFDRLPYRNVVTWNVMIAGYSKQGMGQEALNLYGCMQQRGITRPDAVTFACLLQACAGVGVGALHRGKQLHADIEERRLQNDVVVGGSLVNMYAKCGCVEDARRVFDRLPHKNVVTWTAMIAAYTQQGMGQQALCLYGSMQRNSMPPDSVTFVCLLQACASVGEVALHQGKQLHAQIAERGLQDDVVVGSSLVSMYSKCGSIEDACGVFDKLPHKNVVTWTAMTSGYAKLGMGQQALSLYKRMQQDGITPPDSVTFVCLLQACASAGEVALQQGKQMHAQIEEQGLADDVVVGASLVNMYAKCRRIEDARKVFDKLSQKDAVTWTAMIAGYAQQGMGQEALSVYCRMPQVGITPVDSVTFVCLLQACANIAALPLGKQLHAQIEKQGIQADVFVGTGLVDMYAKCGSMFDSQLVFNLMPEKNIEAWNALIGGHMRQGDSEAVFDLLDRMRLESIQPDTITFLSVLTVCSHVGLVDKGRMYFKAMRTEYGISPTIELYTCLMDLLGRAGHLDEALWIAKTMHFPPNGAVWLSLLGSCRKWNNVEIGRHAFDFAVRLDEKDASSYVLMSSIYAGAQMWDEAKEVQAMRVKSKARKQLGQSWWADMGGLVHTFVVGDKKHPDSEGTYKLEQKVPRLQKERYVPHLHSSSPY